MAHSTSKDYYRVLGVDRRAAQVEIKAAYRRLARKYHPDVNPTDSSAEARFKEISEAYHVVGDPERRKRYDRFGHGFEQYAGHGSANPFDMYGGAGGGFETLFEQFFGGFGAAQARPKRIQAGTVKRTVELSLEEIDSGATRTLIYQVRDCCPRCDGAGNSCRKCSGHGTVVSNRKVEVKVPAGIGGGQQLRVSGGGSKGSGGRIGDLFVEVRETPHMRFKRIGQRLETTVTVPFTTAALGGETSIATLRGSVRLTIPEGSQPGQQLRLSNQGIATLGGKRSDLVVKLQVSVPNQLTKEQRRLLNKLREGGQGL